MIETFFAYMSKRKEMKVKGKIANLEAQVNYLQCLRTAGKNSLPMELGFEISDKLGQIAELKVQLEK